VASNALAKEVLSWNPTRSDLNTIVTDAWAAHQTL
jgi:UDP-glucose 4-epimerase